MYPKLKGVRVKCRASLYIEGKLIESQSGEVLFSEQDYQVFALCNYQDYYLKKMKRQK